MLYFQGISLTWTQVLLLPPKTTLFEAWEGDLPLSTPPKHTQEVKNQTKPNLILCYKINKGLDEHQGAPLWLMVSSHFPAVQSCLLPFSANMAHQKTTALLYRSEDCNLISQKWLHNQRPKQTDSRSLDRQLKEFYKS